MTHRQKGMLVTAGVVVVGYLVWYVLTLETHATDDECHDIVEALYKAQGWGFRFGDDRRVAAQESVASCTKAIRHSQVKCFLTADNPFTCPGAFDVKIDDDVEHGIFCATQTYNGTGAVAEARCWFTDRDCLQETGSEDPGFSWSPCKTQDNAYGILARDGKTWYGLAPTLPLCNANYDVVARQVSNVLRGCRSVKAKQPELDTDESQ